MANEKMLSKLNIGGELYNIKDAEARTRLTQAEADIDALESGKQNVIDASNKLAASYVSFAKDGSSKLTSTDVNAALLELEDAIETGGTGSIVNVVKKETAESGYFATYEITQGGEKRGVSINIPKDFLVKSASIKKGSECVPTQSPADHMFIDFVVNVKEGTVTDEHIFLDVAQLVDAYIGDEQTIHLDASTNTFSVLAIGMDKVTGLENTLNLKAKEADLQAEIKRATEAEALKEDKSALKALAYADTATGAVPSQTISGVKASGDLSGSVSMTIASTPTAATLTKGNFTPAGSITGEAIKGGSINVTLKDAASASAAVLDTADYTPSGDVTVTLKDNTFNAITGVGSLPSKQPDSWTANVPTVIDTAQFNGGSAATWTGASHTAASLTSQTTGDFVNEAIVVDGYDAESETLSFKAAPTAKAVTDRGAFTPDTVNFGTFNGGSAASLGAGFYTPGSAASFTEGTFSQGELPTMALQTVAVNTAAFEGDAAADLKVNGVSYMKQVVDAKEFTPVAATLGFSGSTAENVLVTGVNYDKANASQSGNASIVGAELAVDDINVAAKNVTVSPTV